MAYFISNIELDIVMCNDCGEQRWEEHPKYGTNVDARLEEAKATGLRWAWTPRWSECGAPCLECGGLAN